MGEHESPREPPSGLLLNGLLPDEAGSVIRVLDSERWLRAEERTAELIACIQPNMFSEERRSAVADYVQRLIIKCFPCQVFTFGSVPLKTYLPDGDIDLTAFSDNQTLKDTWAHQVRDMLENEEKNEHAEFRVKEVQYIQAEVKLIKCLVENIVVDISFNQLGGLCTLCFLEEVDHMINQNHLFKRSIILIKAWCYYESRILGAHHGLISTYALETLVLYIFHVFNNSFTGPLEVLYRFLEFFSKFDWDNFCLSLWGPVPISSLPDVTAEPPRKDGGMLLLSKLFLDVCSTTYAVFPGGQENQGQVLVSKHFNVIDPLRVNNNLGRSVSKGNFFRIRSAFAFGAKRLARLLDCPQEDLCSEVNQFFMNTWDRHGSGLRPDAPRNGLWRVQLSKPDHQHEPGSLRNNLGLGGKRNEFSAGHESQVDRPHASTSSQLSNNSVESTFRASSVSSVTHAQPQKNFCNLNNSRTSDQGRREIFINPNTHNDKGYRSSKPDNVINDMKGRYLFARTRSSPELTDTYNEVLSHGWHNKLPESMKSQTSSKLDSRRKNLESDTLASHDIRSSTDDPSSVRHTASPQSLDAAAESKSYSNEILGMGQEFSSTAGTQGMQQEEQDFMNMIASYLAHGYNGQVHIPLNLASGQLPLPLPSSVLASMGYSHRNLCGTVPTNVPFIETAPGANMQFPQSSASSNSTHFFPGNGLISSTEDSLELVNGRFSPVETTPTEVDNDYWHEQDRRSSGRLDLDDGNFEVLQSDDKQQSTSAGNLAPSFQVGASDSVKSGPHKFSKDARGSVREDHENSLSYLDNRGNEVHFEDRSICSRSIPSSHTSKTNSESSWEGSSAKLSKPVKDKKGRKTTPTAVTMYGKGKSVSEHTSFQADDDNGEWNLLPSIGTEMPDNSIRPQSLVPLHFPKNQMRGSEEAQTNGSDSVIPMSPVLLGPGLRERSGDNSGVVPLAFYPTGPPVPFFTMLPVYNFSTDTGTSTSHISGEEGIENDSGQTFDLSEGLDRSEVSDTSNSMGRSAPVELMESKSDILNSDFFSHWQNLQYGRFCQNPLLSSPLISSSPMTVPPVYLQGRVPWDGSGGPVSANMNLFTQIMSYGPRLVPVTPPLSATNRPTGVYQRYIDEMPRYRAGTGTYLPNHKVPSRDCHPTNSRRGNYNHDRSDHHREREGNWHVNSKSRVSGRSHNRNQSEKSSSRPERLVVNESRAERPWSSQRHDTFPPYHSQSSPFRSNSAQGAAPNMAYGMYPLSAMNSSEGSSNGPTIPPVVMLYPYDHNAPYASPTEQLEFGSLGPVGLSGVNEVSQHSEESRSSGAFEEQRYHGISDRQSSPDHPSPHVHRGR